MVNRKHCLWYSTVRQGHLHQERFKTPTPGIQCHYHHQDFYRQHWLETQMDPATWMLWMQESARQLGILWWVTHLLSNQSQPIIYLNVLQPATSTCSNTTRETHQHPRPSILLDMSPTQHPKHSSPPAKVHSDWGAQSFSKRIKGTPIKPLKSETFPTLQGKGRRTLTADHLLHIHTVLPWKYIAIP